jgi:hypothetical protein
MVTTRQPFCLSALVTRRSRRLLISIFVVQKTAFVRGSFARGQFRWPCQKQPFTKIAVFLDLMEKSGCPGRLLSFRRYFSPNSRRNVPTLS